MLTTKDIKNLTEFQEEVFKNTFATKADVKDIKASLNILTTAVDSFAQEMRGWRQEKTFIDKRLERHDEWFKLLSEKVGIKLPN